MDLLSISFPLFGLDAVRWSPVVYWLGVGNLIDPQEPLSSKSQPIQTIQKGNLIKETPEPGAAHGYLSRLGRFGRLREAVRSTGFAILFGSSVQQCRGL